MAAWTDTHTATKPFLYLYTRQSLLDWFLLFFCLMYFQQCKTEALLFSSDLGTATGATLNPTFTLVYLCCFLGISGVALARWSTIDLPSWSYEHPVLAAFLLYAVCFSLLKLPKAYVDNGYIQLMINVTFLMPIAVVALRSERQSGLVSAAFVCASILLLFVSGLIAPIAELLHRVIGGFDVFREASDATIRQRMVSSSIMTAVAFGALSADAATALISSGYLVTPFPQRGSPYYGWVQRILNGPSVTGLLLLAPSACILLLVLYGQALLLRYVISPWFLLINRVPYWDVLCLGVIVAIHYAIARAIQRRSGQNHETQDGEDSKSDLSIQF